jgi:two-component sensor histidine kinase
MADVARRVVRMLEGSLGREDVHIELQTASVQVDAAVATPLAVILNELIQNAIEHGLGDGHGTVTVELRGGDDQPVVLQVHDDGNRPVRHPDPVGPSEPARQPDPARRPDPGAVADPAREPDPAVSGPPDREGSRGREAAQLAVHSPWVAQGPGVGYGAGGGLGLRLVRALVEEELNGRFTLTHPAGRGSIATAVIPPVERSG